MRGCCFNKNSKRGTDIRAERQIMKREFVGGINLVEGKVLVVKSIETLIAVIKFFKREDLFEAWRREGIPDERYQEWMVRRTETVKPDLYGFPGGMVDEEDYESARIEGHGDHLYSTLQREVWEETRLEVVSFERIITFGAQSPIPSHFYLIKTIGELKDAGTPGEAEAPRYLELSALNPENCFPKHCLALKAALTKEVKRGRQEYLGHLDRISRDLELKFPAPARPVESRPRTWEDEVRGVRPLK